MPIHYENGVLLIQANSVWSYAYYAFGNISVI